MNRTVALASLVCLAVTGCSAASVAAPAASTSVASPSAPLHIPQSGTGTPGTSAASGFYLSYEQCVTDPTVTAGTTQVLFFFDRNCPECVAADDEFALTGLPAGLTVIKVTWDAYPELQERFGVKEPGTFVQLNGLGEKVKAWQGSTNGQELARRLKL